jgi:hypothetical protein
VLQSGLKRPGSCVSVVSSDAPSRDSGRLGEAVVSGSVTPDQYLLDDQGRIHHFQPGEPGSTKRLPDHVLEQRARLGIAVARSSGARKILSGRTPMITCGYGRRPVDRLVPVSPRPTLDVLAALWRLATLAYRNSQHRWTDDPRFAEFLTGVRSLAAQELATMPCSWLKKMPRWARDLSSPSATCESITCLPPASRCCGCHRAALAATVRAPGSACRCDYPTTDYLCAR